MLEWTFRLHKKSWDRVSLEPHIVRSSTTNRPGCPTTLEAGDMLNSHPGPPGLSLRFWCCSMENALLSRESLGSASSDATGRVWPDGCGRERSPESQSGYRRDASCKAPNWAIALWLAKAQLRRQRNKEKPSDCIGQPWRQTAVP